MSTWYSKNPDSGSYWTSHNPSIGPGDDAGTGFTPPTIGQIFPRSNYYVGSNYNLTAGQLWPRGTGHSD